MCNMDRDLDTLTDDVCTTLQLLDVKQLGQCCVTLDVVIPPAKMGKKAAMKTMLMRHLTSDAVQDDEKAEGNGKYGVGKTGGIERR